MGKRITIGIMALESAAIMSRLICLQRALSDASVRALRSDGMRAQGVSYLTSTDQHWLLSLACSELLSDLDSAAAAVSRLTSFTQFHRGFPAAYAQLKFGFSPSKSGPSFRPGRMAEQIALTSKLLDELETLEGMRKRKPPPSEAELKSQWRKVSRLRSASLWGRTFDEAVSLMSGAVLAIFARICTLFAPLLPFSLHPPAPSRFRFTTAFRLARIHPRRQSSSGPMDRPAPPSCNPLTNSCPIILRGAPSKTAAKAGANSVGNLGLALRYANLVLSAQRFLRMRCGQEQADEFDAEAAKDDIYRQLPVRMREMLKSKLRRRWRERGSPDVDLAKGWREAVERILAWLAPVARDTMMWHEERTLDRRRRLDLRPRLLSIQTFHLSDKDKTEAAIVEVLVGISCMCWYDAGPPQAS